MLRARMVCVHRYTLAAGVGVYAGVFLVRNSRLAGSRNLDTWAAAAVEAAQGAWSNHIVSPLLAVRQELFSTFRE
jgi:nuclear-control-of-ATPase protein 2